MKILCVSGYYKPAFIYGGPTRCTAFLCEALAAIGNDVTVFTTNANGDHNFPNLSSDPVQMDGYSVYYFPRDLYFPKNYFFSPELARACRKETKNFDIVYISGNWTFPLLPAAWSAKRFGKPYVICPHGSYMTWSMRQKRIKKNAYMFLLERYFVNRAAFIQCTSDLEIVQTRNLKLRAPIRLIPNAVNTEYFMKLPSRGKLRDRFGISDTAPVTLFVGRLHKMKRIDFIISNFQEVIRSINDAHLIIVGADEDGTGLRMQQYVRNQGLDHLVHFLGELNGNDLLQAYSDADLLVLLSYRENFGMVAVEAMSSGLPILISKEVGISNLVIENQAGCVVDVHKDDIPKIWRNLLESPDIRRELGLSGQRLVNSEFSLKAVADKFMRICNSIVK